MRQEVPLNELEQLIDRLLHRYRNDHGGHQRGGDRHEKEGDRREKIETLSVAAKDIEILSKAAAVLQRREVS